MWVWVGWDLSNMHVSWVGSESCGLGFGGIRAMWVWVGWDLSNVSVGLVGSEQCGCELGVI